MSAPRDQSTPMQHLPTSSGHTGALELTAYRALTRLARPAAGLILRMRERLNEILVHHTGQPVKRIQEDTERDYIMSADQGKEYGIIDDVIRKRV